jgi:hypothetical protein
VALAEARRLDEALSAETQRAPGSHIAPAPVIASSSRDGFGAQDRR